MAKWISLFLGTMFFVGAIHAHTSSVEAEYQLGDGDSIVSARDNLRYILRKKAAAEYGAIVSGGSRLENGQIRETITTVIEAMVSLRNEVFEKRVTPSGDIILYMKAFADFDDEAIQARYKSLKNNRHYVDRIARLSQSNSEIRRQLQELSLDAEKNILSSSGLLRLTDLKRQLRNNQKQITQAFKPGFLLEIADSAENSTDIEYARLVDLATAKLPKVSVMGVTKSGAGYHVEILYESQFDYETAINAPSRSRLANDRNRITHNIGVAYQLRESPLYALIQIGRHKVEIPYLWSDWAYHCDDEYLLIDGKWGGHGFDTVWKILHKRDMRPHDKGLYGICLSQKRHRFEVHIPKSEASQIGEVDVSIETYQF